MSQPGQETKPPTELIFNILPNRRTRIDCKTARETFNSIFLPHSPQKSSGLPRLKFPLLRRLSRRPALLNEHIDLAEFLQLLHQPRTRSALRRKESKTYLEIMKLCRAECFVPVRASRLRRVIMLTSNLNAYGILRTT
jgi:hypothetical protein